MFETANLIRHASSIKFPDFVKPWDAMATLLLYTASAAFVASPLRPVGHSSPARRPAPRMDFLSNLPGFWQTKVPDGFVRASHILFLDESGEAETKADSALERIRAGKLSFGKAAISFSSCPTREQEGFLGTFATLSSMESVDEMRTPFGTLTLPYEGKDTTIFDDAIFAAPLGEPQKVVSQWGTHLILVTERGSGPRAAVSPVASADAPVEVKIMDEEGKSL